MVLVALVVFSFSVAMSFIATFVAQSPPGWQLPELVLDLPPLVCGIDIELSVWEQMLRETLCTAWRIYHRHIPLPL
jgi:hypothetical protein